MVTLVGFFLIGYTLLIEPALFFRFFGFGGPAAYHHPSQVKLLWLFAGLAILLFYKLTDSQNSSPSKRKYLHLDIALGLYLLADAVSIIFSSHRQEALIPFMCTISLGLAYLALRIVFRSNWKYCANAWILGSILTGIFSFAIIFLAPNAWFKEVPWEKGSAVIETLELVGPYGNPNHLASVILLVIFAALSVCTGKNALPRWQKPLPWLGLGILSSVLGLSLSRGAWLAAGVTAVLSLTVRWKLRRNGEVNRGSSPHYPIILMLLVTLVIFATITFAPTMKKSALGDLGTFTKRISYWNVAIRAWKECPIVGHGPGTYERTWASYRPADFRLRGLRSVAHFTHSLPLQRLSETGLLGVVTLLVFFFFILYPLIQPHTIQSSLTTGLGWGCIAFIFHNIVATTAYVPATAAAFIVTLALYACALEESGLPSISTKTQWLPIGTLGMAMTISFFFCLQYLCVDALFHKSYLLRSQEPRTAEMILNKILRMDPSHLRARYDRACIMASKGSLTSAAREFAAIDAFFPGFDEVVANRCIIALQSENWQDALLLGKRAIERDSANVVLWMALARAQWNLGNKKASRASLEKAITLKPLDPELLRIRAATAH